MNFENIVNSATPYAELVKDYAINVWQRAYIYFVVIDLIPILFALAWVTILTIAFFKMLKMNKNKKMKKATKQNVAYVITGIYILAICIIWYRQRWNVTQLTTTILLPELRVYSEYKKITNNQQDSIISQYILKDVSVSKIRETK